MRGADLPDGNTLQIGNSTAISATLNTWRRAMLLFLMVIAVLLAWVFGRFDIWGFEARPILIVFGVLVLLVQLLFRTRIRYR